MADNILRLKVETSEYDAKLASAAKGIRHLADVAHKGAGDLTGLEKSELDYIKALGEMETKSRTASGQVRELSGTYKELKVIYDQLNEVEKADEGGKALATSLETLRTRAQAAKAQLDSATSSLNDNGEAGKGTSRILEALKDKFTINIDALTLFNKGLQAGKAALDVATDAFFASESNVDEWGRTVQAAQGLYVGFLNALNNGDISGYLDRMSQIVQAARQAYNELDTLGTMKTIQSPQKSRQQTENERIRSMIQTGRYIAPMDGRRNTVFRGKEMQNGQLLTPGQIRALERQLQNGMKTTVTLIGHEVKQTGKAIDAYYNSIAKQNGMSMKEFRKGVSSWDEFSKKMQGYENYKQWDSEARTEFAKQGGRGSVNFDKSNPYAEFRKWGNFRVDKMGENSYNDLTQLIQQRDQQMAQAYSMQTQAYRTMNRAEGMTVSKIMRGETGGTSGGGKTGGNTTVKELTEEEKLQQQINELVQQGMTMDEQGRAAQRVKIADLQAQLQTYKDIENELRGIEKKEKPVEIATGTSITNEAGMSMYIASLKKQLASTDYGSSDYSALSAEIADMTTLQNLVGASMKAGLGTAMFDAADETGRDFWTRAMEGSVEDTDWQAIVDKINEKLKAMGLEPISLNFKTGDVKNQAKEMTKDWNSAASAIQSVGSAMSQIEDPAAKVMGTVAQAIATISLTFAKSLDKTFGPWDWIAAAAAGTATMISTISAIHSATGYAQGGIVDGRGGGFVGGTAYSGDNIGNVRLDSGELVLNRAQQSNLESALRENTSREPSSAPYVTGEKIFLGLNNFLMSHGMGQLVTTKSR